MILVWQFAKFLHVEALKGPTLSQTASIGASDDDPDHDGLSNIQEALWNTDPYDPDTDSDGFKDGEEVASGHDPRVPGPNDLIENGNLTDQLASLTVDGLAAGDLKTDSENYNQAWSDITSSVADSATYLFSKTVDPASLHTANDGADDQKSYLQSFTKLVNEFGSQFSSTSSVLSQTLDAIGSDGFTDSIKKSYADQANQYTSILNEGLDLSVPKKLIPTDSEFLSIVQQMRDICQALSMGDADPIKASFALDAVGDMYEKYFTFITDYSTALTDQKIDTSFLNINQ